MIKKIVISCMCALFAALMATGLTACFSDLPTENSSTVGTGNWQDSSSDAQSSIKESSAEESIYSEESSTEEESSAEDESSIIEESSAEENSDWEESESTAPHEHEWGDNEIITAASCEYTGQSKKTCVSCGETEYAKIPALGHDFSRREVETEGTCVEKEWLRMYCVHENCKKYERVQGDVNPDNHPSKWILHFDAVKATCVQMGKTASTICEGCMKYIEPPQELGYGDHEEEIVYGYKSTCQKEGLTNGVKCKYCDEILTAQEIIPIGEHDYRNGACYVCKKAKPSDGLVFALLDDGKSYKVTGIGTCTDTKLIIPDEYNGLPVTAMGYGAFMNSKKITSVIIPDTITVVGENAFSDCIALTSVEIPEGVTRIDDSAFMETDSLKQIALPSSLKEIGNSAFYDSALSSITFPSGLKKIEDYAFYSCDYLVSVNFSNAPASIGDSAFKNCASAGFTKVDVGDGVSFIGKEAFDGCAYLKEVYIGKSVRYIGDDAFDGTMITYAYFAVTEGWRRDNVSVSELDLTIPKQAASLLWQRFYTWTRNVD